MDSILCIHPYYRKSAGSYRGFTVRLYKDVWSEVEKIAGGSAVFGNLPDTMPAIACVRALRQKQRKKIREIEYWLIKNADIEPLAARLCCDKVDAVVHMPFFELHTAFQKHIWDQGQVKFQADIARHKAFIEQLISEYDLTLLEAGYGHDRKDRSRKQRTVPYDECS